MSIIYPFPRARKTTFRCAVCLISFTPSAADSDLCKQCAAGHALSRAAKQWSDAFRPREVRRALNAAATHTKDRPV
jgi:hypothetical protein